MSDIAQGIKSISPSAQDGTLTVRFEPKLVSDLNGRLKPYKNFPVTAKPALEKVADYVRMEMIPRTFAQEGPGWRQLSKRTQRERSAQGYGAQHPILIRSRDLYKELTEKSHPKHVEIIKTGKDARITIGGSSEKFVRNQLGDRDLNIPPRPMLPGVGRKRLNSRDSSKIQDILVRSIRSEMKRNG